MAFTDILDNVIDDGLSGFTSGAIVTALLSAASVSALLGIPSVLFLPILTTAGVMKGIVTGLKQA